MAGRLLRRRLSSRRLVSIRTKLLVALILLSGLALPPLFLVARQSLSAAARRKTHDDIQRAVKHFHERLAALEEQSRLAVGATFGDKALYPDLKRTTTVALDLGLGVEPGSERVLDEVRELFASADMSLVRNDLDGRPMDLLLITSSSGQLIYSAADPAAAHDPMDEAMVRAAKLGQTSSELWTAARARKHLRPGSNDTLYLVVTTPVMRGEVIGAVLRGEGVAASLLPDLAGFANGDVALEVDGSVASTLSLSAGELPSLPDAASSGVVLRGERYLVGASDLVHAGRRLGRAYLLRSYAQEVGAILSPVTKATGAAAVGLLLLSFITASVIARRMSQPIVALEEGARRVGQGDFTVEVRRTTADEVGRLADQFNEMVRGLKQREQIKGLFKRYLNPQVVEELIKNPDKASPGGERRTLTVLFSDLADFTTLSESSRPEDLVTLLNGYFDEAGRALAARGATLDKFIGDAIMCFWNAPLPQADHAARACLGALDLLGVVERVSDELARGGKQRLDCRIGINTGPCIVGNIGSKEAQDYTVIGDAVNLASRLEGAAKTYGTRTLVSAEVIDAAGGAVVARELDLLVVKGRSKPVRVFELLGPSGTAVPHHVERFAEGLTLYRARRFREALAVFQEIAADPPSLAFRKRCETFLAQPPPDDWNGVHILRG